MPADGHLQLRNRAGGESQPAAVVPGCPTSESGALACSAVPWPPALPTPAPQVHWNPGNRGNGQPRSPVRWIAVKPMLSPANSPALRIRTSTPESSCAPGSSSASCANRSVLQTRRNRAAAGSSRQVHLNGMTSGSGKVRDEGIRRPGIRPAPPRRRRDDRTGRLEECTSIQ